MRNKFAQLEIKKAIDETFLNELVQVGTNAYGTTYFVINPQDRPDLHEIAHRPMSWERFLNNKSVQKSIETNDVFQRAIQANGSFIAEGYTISICVCYQGAVHVKYLPRRLHEMLRWYGKENNLFIAWPMLQAVKQTVFA